MFSVLMYLENELKNGSPRNMKVLVPARFKESLSTIFDNAHQQKDYEENTIKVKKLNKLKPLKSKPKIDRPLSSFFIFFQEHRSYITNQFPKGTKSELITRKAGELWRELDENKKKKYLTMASEAREKWNNEKKVGLGSDELEPTSVRKTILLEPYEVNLMKNKSKGGKRKYTRRTPVEKPNSDTKNIIESSNKNIYHSTPEKNLIEKQELDERKESSSNLVDQDLELSMESSTSSSSSSSSTSSSTPGSSICE